MENTFTTLVRVAVMIDIMMINTLTIAFPRVKVTVKLMVGIPTNRGIRSTDPTISEDTLTDSTKSSLKGEARRV